MPKLNGGIINGAGHANVQTDIKEAVFLGQSDDLVAAGSDDGNVFIYDAQTGHIVRILQADADVANCVQVPCAAALLCVPCAHLGSILYHAPV